MNIEVITNIIGLVAIAVYLFFPVVIFTYIAVGTVVLHNKENNSIKAQILRGLYYASGFSITMLEIYVNVRIKYSE